MADSFSDLPQWLAVGGASAWAARRVLGGSLDAVGETLERWTRLRLENDDLVVEYLGGVLASSRTELGRDDRGNGFTRLVAGLSTYELRHHYICYAVVRGLLVGSDVDVRDYWAMRSICVFVPEEEWVRAMDVDPSEDVFSIHFHTVQGLSQAGLLAPEFFDHRPDFPTRVHRGRR